MKRVIFILVILFSIIFINNCQSRVVSRWTGKALKLKLPTDFDKPISFASGRKGEKDLFYWTTEGELKVKTYTDWALLESEIMFIKK